MYKFFLCRRYLRTRYLAMVCIVSVMLGVATLIVVNSVMSGFSTTLKERLHGLLSDVVLEAPDYSGFDDPEGKMAHIRKDPILNDKIEAMCPTLEIFAMLQFNYHGTPYTRPVRLIGIDPEARARVGGFSQYLENEENRLNPSFKLTAEAQRRHDYNHPPMAQRSQLSQHSPFLGQEEQSAEELKKTVEYEGLPSLPYPQNPSKAPPPKHYPIGTPHVAQGAIIGYSIGHYRERKVHATDKITDKCVLKTGEDIVLTTVSGARLAPVHDRFVVSDYIKTGMSEYDSNYVYVPLAHLQKLRGMEGKVTAIQIKLKDYNDAEIVTSRLREMFSSSNLEVQTWEEKQGPLLAAIRVEKGILNVLLFMIIAVAGFGILAIFSMIVVEKTRDIGILKALGASNGGIMKIFLGYGLLLGLVGAGLGTVLGLVFTHNINEIEEWLATITQQEIFPRDVYYFDKIPVDIQPMSVLLVNLGAIAIAVLFSVLPALRAALLHPVRALRYE